MLPLPREEGVPIFRMWCDTWGPGCRWKWIEDHTERSAWIAAVVAAGAFLIAIGVSIFLKNRLAQQEIAKEKGEDVEKAADTGVSLRHDQSVKLMPCGTTPEPRLAAIRSCTV